MKDNASEKLVDQSDIDLEMMRMISLLLTACTAQVQCISVALFLISEKEMGIVDSGKELYSFDILKVIVQGGHA